MSVLSVDQNRCMGCGACYAVCKRKAISIDIGNEGFLMPYVNSQICNDCKLCEIKCPALKNEPMRKNFVLESYCCQLLSEEDNRKSSSGGAFVALSDAVLQSEGIVFGAALNQSTFELKHIAVDNSEDREQLCGSKYLQSRLAESLSQVKNYLEDGKNVLFSGTPCQVDALYSFLGTKEIEGLYTIDLLCHGVPNIKVFHDYLDWLQDRYGKIVNYIFRDKSLGMKGSNVKVVFENGRVISNTSEVNSFDSLYSRTYLTRPSCFNCKYASLERVGDISIGDCWGIERTIPDWDTLHGASLVLINSNRGKVLWDKAKYDLNYKKIDMSDHMQPSLQSAVIPPVDYAFFWKYYRKKGYLKAIQLFANGSLKAERYRKIRYYFEKIRRIINK